MDLFFSMNREHWADIAKFIAIFLMVWAHIGVEYNIKCFIHVFHMPLFFFISGYFAKENNELFLITFRKNLRTLIIPYFCFSFFAIVYCWIYPYRHPELYPGIKSIQDFFIAIAKGTIFMDDSVSYRYFMPNFALWFLIALFIDKILFWFLNKLFFDKKYKDLIWLGSIVLALIVFPHLSKIKYYSIDSAVMGFSLYVTGFLVKKYNLYNRIKSKSLIVLGITLLYTLFIAPKNGIIDVDGGAFGRNVLWFYVNAIIGILMVIAFSTLIIKYFNVEKTFCFLGENTLIILGIHGFLIAVLKVIFAVAGIQLVYYTTFLMATMVILLSIPIIKLIRKKLPVIIGLNKV